MLLHPGRWKALWRGLGCEQDVDGLFREILDAHQESRRAYHTDVHVAQCLAEFDRCRMLLARPAEAEMAIWFHDAVYDPGSGDNEEKSARWAKVELERRGVAADSVSLVETCILATRHDVIPDDPDARYVVDVDISILGYPEEAFSLYEARIRREYEWVPSGIYAKKRAEILGSFLSRKSVFLTEIFQEVFEERARKNLEAAIRKHSGAGSSG